MMLLAVALICVGFMLWLFIKSLYPIRMISVQADLENIADLESKLKYDPNDEDASKKILDKLSSSEDSIVTSALRTLGRIDSNYIDELSILAEYLDSPKHAYRRAAILAVKDKGKESVVILSAIIDCMSNSRGFDVEVFAAQVIREIGPEASSALPALEAARDDPINSSFRSTFESAIDSVLSNNLNNEE